MNSYDGLTSLLETKHSFLVILGIIYLLAVLTFFALSFFEKLREKKREVKRHREMVDRAIRHASMGDPC